MLYLYLSIYKKKTKETKEKRTAILQRIIKLLEVLYLVNIEEVNNCIFHVWNNISLELFNHVKRQNQLSLPFILIVFYKKLSGFDRNERWGYHKSFTILKDQESAITSYWSINTRSVA